MPSKSIAHVPGVPYSSHNLSHTNRFTTAPGVLKPVLIDELVPGGRYRLDIGMLADTFPTENPLYGTFEVHTDVFLCPIKNWYASLHTNFPSTSDGPDSMSFHYIDFGGAQNRPQFTLVAKENSKYHVNLSQTFPVLPDSLFDYLGFPVSASPWGQQYAASPITSQPGVWRASVSTNEYSRHVNAHGAIAYYDIWRSYYCNPQEPYFYMYASTGYDGTISSSSPQLSAGSYSIYPADRRGLSYLESLIVPDVTPDGFISSRHGFVNLERYDFHDLLNALNAFYTSYIDDFSNSGSLNFQEVMAQFLGVRNFGLPWSGFVTRTYRPDLLTSWISQDGIQSVRRSSRIAIGESNSIFYEQILTGQKVYDYTTHAMISGNRYKDWTRAIYRVTPNMDSDQPILLSHSRVRMDFQGIYQNSGTESGVSPDNQRSVLGGSVSVGQAQQVNDSIVFDCTQPSILVVMNSVIPIADYSQGIDPMLLHTDFQHCYAPDFDGIGWQPLTIGMLAPQIFPPRLAPVDGATSIQSPWRTSDPFTEAIGFQPSWEEYRSRVNRVHGDFHDTMSNYVLKRLFPYGEQVAGTISNVDKRVYSSYIIPEMYTGAWSVSNANPFRIQYAFGYRSRLPMSKYSLPKIA